MKNLLLLTALALATAACAKKDCREYLGTYRRIRTTTAPAAGDTMYVRTVGENYELQYRSWDEKKVGSFYNPTKVKVWRYSPGASHFCKKTRCPSG